MESGGPGFRGPGSSAQIKAEFVAIGDGFDKLAPLAGHGGEVVRVNAGATAYESVSFATLAAAYLTAAAAASTYLPLGGGVLTGTVQGATSLSQVLQLRNDGAYISFYSSDGVTRNGFVQGNGGAGAFDIVADTGKRLRLYSNSAVRAEWASAGELGLNAAPVGTVAIRVQNPGNNDVGLEWQRTAANAGILLSYNRSGGAYTKLRYEALDHTWGISGTSVWSIDTSGHLTPFTNNASDFGNASFRPRVIYGIAGNYSGTVTAAGFSGPLTGNVTGNVSGSSGSCTGNAATATSATTAGSATTAASAFTITTNGTDGVGNEIGYKGLPTASVTSGAFVAADRGKIVKATGGVTVPNSTMAAGDVVTIYNTTGAPITITAAIATLRLAGTASVGARTLASRGIATVYFDSPTDAAITGSGLS